VATLQGLVATASTNAAKSVAAKHRQVALAASTTAGTPHHEALIRSIIVTGPALTMDVIGGVTSGGIDWTIDQVPTLTLVFDDAERTLLRSGIFVATTTCIVAGDEYSLWQLSKSGDSLTSTWIPTLVKLMKKNTTRLKVERGRGHTRVSFARRIAMQTPGVRFFSPRDPAPSDLKRNPSDPKPTLSTSGGFGGAPNGPSFGSTPVSSAPSNPQTRGRGFSSTQKDFIVAYASGTGLDIGVVAAQLANEESVGATLPSGHNDQNWLNVGNTDTRWMGGSVWTGLNGSQAGDLSAKWATGVATIRGFGHAAPSIQDAISGARGKPPAVQISALQHSGWASSGYPSLPSIYASVVPLVAGWHTTAMAPYGSAGSTLAQIALASLANATSGIVDSSAAGPYDFYRGKPGGPVEDTWACLTRLAAEIAWRKFFVVGTNTVWFISDDDLLRQPVRANLQEFTNSVDTIDFALDEGAPRSPLTVNLRVGAWKDWTGAVFTVEGVGPADPGYWICTSVKRDLFDAAGTLTLSKKLYSFPEPVTSNVTAGAGGSRTTSTAAGGSPTTIDELGNPSTSTNPATTLNPAQLIGANAFTLSPIRQRIVAEAALAYNNRSRFTYAEVRPIPSSWASSSVTTDCSGFATLVFKAAGAPDPNGAGYNGSGNTSTLQAHGSAVTAPKPGDLIFYTNPDHVAVYVGSGKVVEFGGDPMHVEPWNYRTVTAIRSYVA